MCHGQAVETNLGEQTPRLPLGNHPGPILDSTILRQSLAACSPPTCEHQVVFRYTYCGLPIRSASYNQPVVFPARLLPSQGANESRAQGA